MIERRVLSTMATTSARSAAGTANLSSVCATSSMNAPHSPGVIRRVPVRALHVLAGVLLRTSGGPAQHLGNKVFEACRRYLVVRVVDQGIGVEPRVGHHTVDEVVYDGRDAVDTAEPLVKVGRILRGHWHFLLPHSAKFEGMARFWLSLASFYGDTLRRTPQAHLRPLSTLTDQFADTDVAFGSKTDLRGCRR